jgi:hypothetical protein
MNTTNHKNVLLIWETDDETQLFYFENMELYKVYELKQLHLRFFDEKNPHEYDDSDDTSVHDTFQWIINDRMQHYKKDSWQHNKIGFNNIEEANGFEKPIDIVIHTGVISS